MAQDLILLHILVAVMAGLAVAVVAQDLLLVDSQVASAASAAVVAVEVPMPVAVSVAQVASAAAAVVVNWRRVLAELAAGQVKQRARRVAQHRAQWFFIGRRVTK